MTQYNPKNPYGLQLPEPLSVFIGVFPPGIGAIPRMPYRYPGHHTPPCRNPGSDREGLSIRTLLTGRYGHKKTRKRHDFRAQKISINH